VKLGCKTTPDFKRNFSLAVKILLEVNYQCRYSFNTIERKTDTVIRLFVEN